MQFIDQLAPDDRDRCLRVLSAVAPIRTHRGLLDWCASADLQGLLPHDIMIALWGDIGAGTAQFDTVSALPGVRTALADADTLLPAARQLFLQWAAERRTVAVDAAVLEGAFPGVALAGRIALVQGLRDERSGLDSCYIVVSRHAGQAHPSAAALSALLPHLDAGMRQVAPLPRRSARAIAKPYHDNHSSVHRMPAEQITLPAAPNTLNTTGMTERELQIMRWVEMGKTNHEIGTILDISAFTVKNHLQRIFKKLDVYSRAQAVSRFKDSMLYG